MKEFLDKDFMLSNDSAQRLYHECASKLPIIDYHCHIDPKEIYEDKGFNNITEIALGVGGSFKGDHYKWRYMRTAGVSEEYITGTKPDDERFVKWVEALSTAIGNPLYHWSHLELKNYFGFKGHVTKKNAKEVYLHCNKVIREENLTARTFIKNSNVETICTTDDPIDDLKYHKLLAEDKGFVCRVLPTFRPDRAREINKEDFPEYIGLLSKASGVDIDSFSKLKEALTNRINHFDDCGCKVSDHGLDYVSYRAYTEKEVDGILKKRLRGEFVSEEEYRKYSVALMVFLVEAYSQKGWAMQLHYGVKRNNNERYFKMIGADSGHDSISSSAPISELADFLDLLDKKNSLPKTIIYSLNPIDNAAIGTIIGCFQDGVIPGKIQHGSAWWFNDHNRGMRDQMESLANLGSLRYFIGMLTDSRSFLSYARHEYFRRIVCDIVGTWVENGLYPSDYELLEEIVSGICYYNAKNYFGF